MTGNTTTQPQQVLGFAANGTSRANAAYNTIKDSKSLQNDIANGNALSGGRRRRRKQKGGTCLSQTESTTPMNLSSPQVVSPDQNSNTTYNTLAGLSNAVGVLNSRNNNAGYEKGTVDPCITLSGGRIKRKSKRRGKSQKRKRRGTRRKSKSKLCKRCRTCKCRYK